VGLFDFFGGGSPAEKALKLKPKITQKYGDAANRQKAIQQAGEMHTPDAVSVLMARFTITVDPQTTDANEKDDVFSYITSMGDLTGPLKAYNEAKKASVTGNSLRDAVRTVRVAGIKKGEADRAELGKAVASVLGGESKELTEALALEIESIGKVREFLKRSDQASSWAVRILETMLEPDEVIGIACEELHRLGTEYTRDPEKKEVLLHFVEGKGDSRIPPEVLLLLEDMTDDVKIAALKVLGPLGYEPAREKMLELLTHEETAKRVQTAAVAALHESRFTVQGYREKVEKRLSDPWYLDGSGAVKRRGAA
jgi:hypothetical protein